LVASTAPHAGAQGSDALPPALSGRWTVVPPGGRTQIDHWSLKLDGPGVPGPVAGKIDWRGRGCGAKDEPFTGTWDGAELSFAFKARPDVNTQLVGATYCGEGLTRIVLRRKPGTRDFDGEGTLNDRSPPFQVTASP
jgi:hypothetical protein